MTEDDIRGMLRELRDEAVPPDSLARVRLAVDRRRSEKSRWWPWVVALAGAVAMVFVAMLLRPVSQPGMPVVGSGPAPAIAEAQPKPVPPQLPKLAVAKKRRTRPHIVSPAPVSAPLVVRIETEDPDVVILLIGD